MKTRNIERAKEVHLELLDEIIDVCNKYGLRYCAYYGTLLGAVRDGCLIQWDYDVDIAMPYEDYTKLYHLNQITKLFKDGVYLSTYDCENPYSMNYQLKKLCTTAIKADGAYEGCNIFLDIYPIFSFNRADFIPSTLFSIGRMFVDSRYLYRVLNKPMCGRANTILLDDTLYNIQRMQSNYDTSVEFHSYVGWRFTSGDITVEGLDRYLKEYIDFDNCDEISFDKLRNKIKIPKNYDSLLTKHYGDWRTPVVWEDKDFDWFIDADRDWTYYRDNKEEFKEIFNLK